MPLNLPENFKNDIQSRDTNLVPLVVIGSRIPLMSGTINTDHLIFISTNSLNFSFKYKIAIWDGWDSDIEIITEIKNTKPILLNIPSLKESIDIEKRNYKISSINIDISNFTHEGKRFSELIEDRSLINTECRVYWISQNSSTIVNYDNIPDDAAFQIYSGDIRRYTHDDEKVRLVVEDRSQATLHRDLPLPENYLGTGDEVPDKYKNKPIPMVYGHVNKSPCVVNHSSLITDDSDVSSGESTITVDSNDVTINGFELDGEPNSKQWLLIFKDDEYKYVCQDTDSIPSEININSFEFESLNQYEIPTNNTITLKSIGVFNQEGDSMVGNPLSTNMALIRHPVKPVSIKMFTSDDAFVVDQSEEFGVTTNFGTNVEGLGDFGKPIECSAISNFIEEPDIITMKNYMAIYDFGMPNDILDLDTRGVYISCIGSYSWNVSDYLLSGNYIPDTHRAGFTMMIINHELGEASYISPSIEIVYGNDNRTGTFRLIDAVWGYSNVWKHHSVQSVIGVSIDTGSSAGITITSELVMPPENIFIDNYYIVDNFFNSDFYVNVNGRDIYYDSNNPDLSTSYPRSAVMQIVDIVKNELGHPLVWDNDLHNIAHENLHKPNGQGYFSSSYWTDFTVNKKISSKKLLENIASVTPIIPRFDNMGNFKFDIIPKNGGVADHTIKEIEVIDFSFSRTKIEDVYTKIQFFYNWDYARGEFSSSVEANVLDYVETSYDYKPEYYGFKVDGEYDHAESTLVIDDRGKYIRDHDTAKNYAEWFLLWSCNQKLKLKIKLPLKMMFLEIGDLVNFDEILGGVKPYGIDYKYGGKVNGQTAFNTFLITSTNKTLEWVEIESIMMHNLDPSANYVFGCFNENAEDCNYVPCPNGDMFPEGWANDLQCIDDGSCLFKDDCGVCVPTGDTSCEHDCTGVANGTAVIDECGVCNGDNSTCLDCNGVINGGWDWDDCGDCNDPYSENWNSACSGCTHQVATNYDETATVDDGSCVFDYCLPFLTQIRFYYDILGGDIILTNGANYATGCNDQFITSEISPEGITLSSEVTVWKVEDHYIRFYSGTPVGLNNDHIGSISEVKFKIEGDNIEIPEDGVVIEIVGEIGDWSNSDGYGFRDATFISSETNLVTLLPMGDNDMFVEHTYPINLIYTITYYDTLQEEDVTYTETIPFNINYQICSNLGDLNGDGGHNVLDIVTLANCIIANNCAELENGCAGDLNGDGGYNVLDIVNLTNCVLANNCGG